MKIKSDFVTNSSSTAFVIISRSALTRDGVRRLVGVSPGSPLEAVADRLYELLDANGQVVRWVPPTSKGKAVHDPAVEDIATSEGDDPDADREVWSSPTAVIEGETLTQTVVERMRAAVKAGHHVRVGRFRSDGDGIESFLCVDSFEAEVDDYYLNALRCSW